MAERGNPGEPVAAKAGKVLLQHAIPAIIAAD